MALSHTTTLGNPPQRKQPYAELTLQLSKALLDRLKVDTAKQKKEAGCCADELTITKQQEKPLPMHSNPMEKSPNFCPALVADGRPHLEARQKKSTIIKNKNQAFRRLFIALAKRSSTEPCISLPVDPTLKDE